MAVFKIECVFEDGVHQYTCRVNASSTGAWTETAVGAWTVTAWSVIIQVYACEEEVEDEVEEEEVVEAVVIGRFNSIVIRILGER